MHFRITEKPTTDSNNAGLWPHLYKVSEKIASEKAENYRSRQQNCRLTPLLMQGTSVNVRINLILPETTVIGLHFCR